MKLLEGQGLPFCLTNIFPVPSMEAWNTEHSVNMTEMHEGIRASSEMA